MPSRPLPTPKTARLFVRDAQDRRLGVIRKAQRSSLLRLTEGVLELGEVGEGDVVPGVEVEAFAAL